MDRIFDEAGDDIKFNKAQNKQNNLIKLYQYLIQNCQIYQIYYKKKMINIQSPFLGDIPECKLVMRRLRKKISKYTSAHKEAKKPRDQSHDILNILKSRNLPAFILDTIRKRRTFDLLCLKSVVLNGESSLEEMSKLVGNQQAEIQTLFAEHKCRIKKTHHIKSTPKLERRSTNSSSTEQDDASEGNSEFNSNEFTESFDPSPQRQQNYSDKEEIMEQNNFYDAPGFHGRDFLSFQGEIYSEEEWLKF